MNPITKKKIALLCDYGLDDAIATLFLLNYAERFLQIDILPVGGNFSREKAQINAKRLLSHCEKLPCGIRIVDTSAIPQPCDDLPFIHGQDGMGDVIGAAYEEKAPVIGYDDWLKEVDDDYLLLSLGPCTVTEDILKKKGALPLVMMCGNIAEPPNQGDYEFNHAINRSAFTFCTGYPHAAATLDSCHHPKGDLNALNLEGEDLLHRLLRAYHHLSVGRKEPACYVYDLTAVLYVLFPERFDCSEQRDRDGNRVTVLRYVSEKSILD